MYRHDVVISFYSKAVKKESLYLKNAYTHNYTTGTVIRNVLEHTNLRNPDHYAGVTNT